MAESKAVVARAQYTPEQKEKFVRAVLDGMPDGLTLKDTARRKRIRPGTLRMWIARNPVWHAEYVAMKPHLAGALVDEALELSKNSTSSTTAVDRVRIDLLKWVASKSDPESFGDRMKHEGTQDVVFRVVEEGGRQVATISATAKVADQPAPLGTLPDGQ
jgi:transposase-like protein